MAKPLCLLGFILIASLCLGQDSPIKFYEAIEGDSVMIFFNERYHYVEKKCAKFLRLTKIDGDGNYVGDFKDFRLDSSFLGSGAYLHGKKNGYFELYHPTGKILCKGNYLKGKPIGQWDFYFENGLPERTIQFTETDTLLLRLIDEKGNIKVIDGSGEFDGPVTGRSNSNDIIAKGKIVDGRPEGKWTSTFANNVYCKEDFVNGRLVKGIFPEAKVKGEKQYKNKSFLKTFLLWHYADNLEKIFVEKCSDSLQYISDKYSYNTKTFTLDLTNQLHQGIMRDVMSKNTLGYWYGNQYITIEFTHDKTGRPENFKLLSAWGQPFYTSITNALRSVVRHAPNKKMYLHLRLNLIYYNPGYSFGYQYLITPNRVIRPADIMN